VVLGLAGALVGVVPNEVSGAVGRAQCRSTAFVTNQFANSVSTIDVKTRTKYPTDIPVSALPAAVAVTPDGKTVFVTNAFGDSVSTIDVKTRTKHPADIPVGMRPFGVAVTPDGKTAFVTNGRLQLGVDD
jgi:YVTN family beta-propeller protein